MTIIVPIITCLPRLYQQCTNSVPIVKNSQKQSKDSQNSKNNIGVPIVTGLSRLYQASVPTVYQLSKAVKNSQTAKMTIGVPIVTCLHRVCRIHKVRVRRLHPPNTQSHYFVMTVNGF